MNRPLSFALALLALAPVAAPALDVTVTVTGIRNAKGKIAALAFSNKTGFPDQPDKALARAVVEARKGTVTLTLKNLPPGKLAITVLHDEDGNGKLNRNLFRLPLEGAGMSGNPEGKLPPTFADAAEPFDRSRKLSIPLKYWSK